jgi:hypothetical protein
LFWFDFFAIKLFSSGATTTHHHVFTDKYVVSMIRRVHEHGSDGWIPPPYEWIKAIAGTRFDFDACSSSRLILDVLYDLHDSVIS